MKRVASYFGVALAVPGLLLLLVLGMILGALPIALCVWFLLRFLG